MEFREPAYFLLLIPLVATVFWVYLRRRKREPSIQFSSIKLFEGMKPGFRARLYVLPPILKILGLVFIIVALARPQQSDTKIKRNVEGIDIVIAFDISDSMLIEDMKPENRLEAAKMVAKNFIEKRISDRIGLVLFSGEAFTKVPPTLDYKILLQALAEVEPTRNVKMGTAIGVALANSVARLKDSTARSRVIVLMTDGENNSGTIDPETALEIAKGYSIKVYTIGMGVDGMSQLPVWTEDAFGNRRKRYQPMQSKVNDDLLGRIASETGGKYYRATNTDALQNVFGEINRLERSKIDVNKYTKYTELFQRYLMWALVLLALSVVLNRVLLRRGP